MTTLPRPEDPPAWLPVPQPPEPTDRIRTAQLVALIGGGAGTALVAVGWVLDPDPAGPNTALGLRALGAVAAAILFLIARALARPTRPRVGTLFAGLAVLAFTALLDTLLVAVNLVAWLRTLVFCLAASVSVALLLALLKRPSPRRDEDGLFAFLAEHWLYIGLLAFLIVARVAVDQPLSEILPDLLTNGLFLLLFLSILFRLVTRYLRRFGSPISWTEAKHHRQHVETFPDPRMDEVRGVLKRFIEQGEGTEAYDRVMKAAAERTEAHVPVDQLLARRPAPLGHGVRTVPVATLLGATTCLAAVLGCLAALFSTSTGQSAASSLGWFLAAFGLFFPLLHRGIKGEADPDHPLAWLIGALTASLGVLLVNPVAGVLGLLLPLAPILFYGIPAVRGYLSQRRTQPPQPVAARARAADEVRRDALRALFGASIIVVFLVLYPVVRYATRRVTDLPALDPLWLAGLVAVAILLGVTGLLLGPAYKEHRTELRRLQDLERGQRALYHQRVLETLEGSRT